MRVELVKDTNAGPASLHAGGTVRYEVVDEHGRMVGLVGDGRAWRGWRFGQRRWWSCWREEGDTAARWHSELTHATRAAAVADLVSVLEEAGRGRILCAHADDDGEGMHWLEPGETCSRAAEQADRYGAVTFVRPETEEDR